ncbi:MAG: hypothetical protein AAFQ50_10080, partial [Pseudomonadota bacterium]
VAEILMEGEGFDGPAAAEALRAAWTAARARIEGRHAEIEAAGAGPDRLMLNTAPRDIHPMLTCPPTRPAEEAIYGVYEARGKILMQWNRDMKPVPMTSEALATVTDLSGHEKLALLSHPEQRIARLREGYALRQNAYNERVGVMVGVPLPDPDWIAFSYAGLQDGLDLPTPDPQLIARDGTLGSLHVNRERGELALSLTRGRQRPLIRIESVESSPYRKGNGGPAIYRPGSATVFKTVADLDLQLARVLALLVALDPDMTGVAVPQGDGAISGHALLTHPALVGLDVPAGLWPFLRALLGAPYDKAKREAEAQEARTAKKLAKRDVYEDVADTLPDGRIVGKLRKGFTFQGVPIDATSSYMACAKFGVVSTVPPKGRAKPRRSIEPVSGLSKPRPLTKTHLAKLPPIEDPSALRLQHDGDLGGRERDAVELIHRMSFFIAAGEPNPLLSVPPKIMLTELRDPRDCSARVTRLDGDGARRGVAFAVEVAADGSYSTWQTGAGFGWLTLEGAHHSWLRPARIDAKLCLPDDHRAVIEGLIGSEVSGAAEREAALAALASLWERGPKARITTA